MADYYGELGVAPDASSSELRRAYRERARRLHPDLHPTTGSHGEEPDPGGDAMRRLNEAWHVLGDPRSRRRYDESLLRGRPGAWPDDGQGDEPDDDPARADGNEHGDGPVAGHRLARSWWLVAVAILAAIFVITAYAAGPAPVNPSPGSGRPPGEQCLARFPGYEAFVSCSQPNIGRVVSEYPDTGSSASCPAGSVAHRVLGRADVACLATGG